MPPIVLFTAWYGLLALAFGLAFWRGDAPLRAALAVLLLTTLLGPWLIDHQGWRHVQLRLLLADMVELGVFAWALLRSRSRWSLLITGVQAISVAVHMVAWKSPQTLSAAAYATSLLILSWLILAALLSATTVMASRFSARA